MRQAQSGLTGYHVVLKMQDIQHKAVEMYAHRAILFGLKLRWQSRVEEVHEHRLACPHRAMEV